MSVQRIVTIADAIAKGQRVKFPAMSFRDFDLLIRCIHEART
ncbi:hypothetical protein TUM3794_20250 [Shewanella colwelliana]|uniref:Uncharacterized protein n=1 Tax=Shewanella colwelliana TaxID=23 RepID=A0ABQ4P0F8_SHECO|nr:hypothetical protein [Shewanella colwelliana]GIU40979.1 hypothetical protein TUM3794_20250 [Shewanella colwelliana]